MPRNMSVQPPIAARRSRALLKALGFVPRLTAFSSFSLILARKRFRIRLQTGETRMTEAALRDEEMMLAGLRRLLAEPGAKLFGGGRSRGVFPQRTVAAERAAGLLIERGFLECDDTASCRLTPIGVKWLAENDEVKILLEDILRSAETQRERLESIAESCLKEATRLAQQRMAVSTILARMGSPHPDADSLDDAVLETLGAQKRGPMLADL